MPVPKPYDQHHVKNQAVGDDRQGLHLRSLLALAASIHP